MNKVFITKFVLFWNWAPVQKKYCRQASQENQSHHWSNQIRYKRNSLQGKRNCAKIIYENINQHPEKILNRVWSNFKSFYCVPRSQGASWLDDPQPRSIWEASAWDLMCTLGWCVCTVQGYGVKSVMNQPTSWLE